MTGVADLGLACSNLDREIQRQVGVAKATAERGKALQAEVVETQALLLQVEQAVGVIQKLGDERAAAAQRQIEALVTHGLQTIFGSELSFHLVQEQKRGNAHLDFVVRSSLPDGSVVDTPVLDARGGGVAAVVGFLLRLVVLLLTPSRQAPVLFLDESFAQLSEDYEPRLAEFLRELVDKTPIQIVMVTHSHSYSEFADVVYRLDLEADGRTKIARLS